MRVVSGSCGFGFTGLQDDIIKTVERVGDINLVYEEKKETEAEIEEDEKEDSEVTSSY